MNPRLVIGALAAVAIAVCALLLWRESPAPPVTPATSTVPAAPPAGFDPAALARSTPATAPASKSVPWKSVEELMNSDLFTRQPTAEQIRNFLATRGETAANLVAAFEATQDFQLLLRAEQLFPNNPMVLQALIVSGQEPEKFAERIERFKAADPKNPVPWIYSAQSLFKASDPAAARTEIETALSLPGFYVYTNERTASARALYESMGWSPLEAEIRSVFGLPVPQMQAAQTAGRGLMELQKAATDGGDQAQSEQLLRLTYGLGKMFSTPEASRFLIGQLVGYSLESKALQAMPPDQKLPGGATAAERLAEMDRDKKERVALTQGSEAALGGDPALTLEYLRHVRQDGETSALRWLGGRK